MANSSNSRTSSAKPTADQVDPAQPQETPEAKVEEHPEVAREDQVAPAPSGETIKVKTTGDFNLMDVINGQHIDANVETEVRETQFILDKIASGELERA